MAESAAPFVWGPGGSKNSTRRRLAEALLKSGTSSAPVGHWMQGVARIADALSGQWELNKLEAAEKTNNESFANSLASALAGSGGAPTSMAAASPRSSEAQAGSGQPMNALDAIMKFESGGKNVHQNIVPAGGGFNPSTGTVTGPSSAQGYFQMITPTWRSAANMAGIDTNQYPTAMSAPYEVQRKAAAALYAKEGFAPWAPYNAALRSHIAKNGGAGAFLNDGAGRSQVADIPAAGAAPTAMETGAPGFAVPPASQSTMSAANFNAIHEGQPLDPVFQSEGTSQPWMGTALQPAMPQVAQAPLPPPRPADLAMPQADMPAPGAVPAVGQMPPSGPDWSTVDPNSPDGGVGAFQRIAAGSGKAASPFAGIAQALSGGSPGSAPPPSTPSPAIQNIAQAVAPQPASNGASANPMAALAIALARSGDRDGAVKLATSLLQPVNGVQMGDRLVDPRTGRVIADFTQANGGRSKSYGLNPIWGTDKDGNAVIGQIGEKGDFVQTRMPEGFKPSTGVERIDAGTHWVLQDKRTGQTVGTIPKDLAGAERQKVEGKATGEAAVGLSDAIAKADQFLGSIDEVRKHPGRDGWGGQGSTAAWPIIGNGLPGTSTRDFVARVDQLKGKSFLEAFNSLKGGGAVSEVEGAKATDAIARLDRAQSKEGFDAALKDLEDVVRSARDRARQRAGVSAPTSATSSSGWSEVAPGVRIREKR